MVSRRDVRGQPTWPRGGALEWRQAHGANWYFVALSNLTTPSIQRWSMTIVWRFSLSMF